jgi:alpha-L-rhamnosidase
VTGGYGQDPAWQTVFPTTV